MAKKTKQPEQPKQPKKPIRKTKAAQTTAGIFQVSGRVVDLNTGLGVADLQIEAWHKGGPRVTDNKLVGNVPPQVAKTTAQGDFHITATAAHFEKFSIPARPDLFFRVYRESKLIKSTEDAILKSVESGRKDIVIEVDLIDEVEHTVRGQLLDQETSAPVVGLTVRAVDLDAEPDKDLGSRVSDGNGMFTFTYTTLRRAGQPPPPGSRRLSLSILDQQGEEILETEVTAVEDQIFVIRIPSSTPAPGAIAHEVTGRLLNQTTGQPLAGYTVLGFDLDAGPTPKDLGHDITNDRGLFALIYTIGEITTQPSGEEEEDANGFAAATGRRLRLRILNPQGQQVLQTDVTAETTQVFTVQVSVSDDAPASPTLSAIAATLPSPPPPDLLPFLAERGVTTLAQIRAKGGIGQFANIPGGANNPAVRAFESHADLDSFSSNIQFNAAAVNNGYTTASVIANTTRANFVSFGRTNVGDFNAATTQVVADARAGYLNNVMVGFRADLANGFRDDLFPWLGFDPVPPRCECKDCEAAVSPLAYLADLLDYSLEHVKNSGAAITLQFLTNTFHQPFGQLPASCESMDKQVRQVRICIEVLRAYLAPILPGRPQAVRDTLARAERAYRLETYRTLLNRVGASYDEIRLARTAEQDRRVALADRIGVDLAAARPDHLDALFLDPAAMPEQITERKLEQLFGLVDTTRNPLNPDPEPDLQKWRIEHLRTLWRAQDFPSDQYSEGLLPIIDPDVIGPDDFRRPVAKAAPGDPDQPFDIWLKRRAWVDARLQALAAMTKVVAGQPVPDIEAMMSSMYLPVAYDAATSVTPWAATTPVTDFDGLAENLAQGVDASEIAERLETDLNTTVEAFTRLVAIRTKDKLAEADSRREKVQDAEWREVFSILVQAQKIALISAWRSEEQTAGVRLGQEDFWISLREPLEGDWPPAPTPGRPMIDPQSIRLAELPEPTAGRRAIAFRNARQASLDQIKQDLQDERETNGFDSMLRLALGHPNPTDALQHDPAALANDLRSADPAVVESARTRIINDLHLTVEDFTRMMTIKAKDDDPDPLKKPTVEELNEVYVILTVGRKGKHEFPVWIAEEQAAATGVVYWSALKARLPRWRASSETRQGWSQALRARGQAPIIDPDLIGPGDLVNPFSGAAANLRQARRTWVDNRLAALKAAREAAATPLTGLDLILEDALGIPATDLVELAEARKKGDGIESRLDQLSLTADAFNYLMRIRELLVNGAPVLDSEWQEVYSILTQAGKRRAFAEWREQEQAAGLILSQDYFKIPAIDPTVFPPPPPPELPVWRATRDARRDWQETLQSRIDQRQVVIDALREAVSATEEETLPTLRDALIAATNAQGINLNAKARWITDRLLIDAKAGGCQKTTRISQAIETIHALLFSVRNGLLNDTYPNLDLDADEFDDEWQWIGSYATWRAAMFVFIYPENILIPSLRRWQTPAFRKLVSDLRGNRRLTPEQACRAARTYSDYFRDVSKLKLEASCQTLTRMHKGESCRDRSGADYRTLFYVFARGGATNTAYWTAYDPGDTSGYAQTFWDEIPGFKGLVNLIGAAVYQQSPEERFIYLFARTQEKGKQKLVFTKYDLEKGKWDDEPGELEPPKEKNQETTSFSAVVKQSGRETVPPHLAIRIPNGAIYDRQLNRDGSDWADGDWKPRVGPLVGGRYAELCAMVEIADEEFYLVARTQGGAVRYRLFGSRDEGEWRHLGFGSCRGAFRWPGSQHAYVFFGSGSSSSYRAIKRSSAPVGSFTIPNLFLLDFWLSRVTGVSLTHWVVVDSTQYSGMTLLNFFTLNLANDPHRITLPFFQDLADDVVREFHRQRVLLYIDYIASQLESKEEWKEWKLADEMVLQFAGVTLKQALTNAFDNTPTAFRRRIAQELSSTLVAVSGLDRIVPTAGSGSVSSASSALFAFQLTSGQTGVYRCGFTRDGDQLFERGRKRLAPYVTGPFDISERFSELKLQLRRFLIEGVFNQNQAGPQSNLTYLEEAYYAVPVHLAMQLQSRSQYTAALDWFRSVYDYSQPLAQRKIYFGLKAEESLSSVYQRADDWLLDPLNPHAIAATRANTYTRFTLLAIIRCFLEFADAEFTRDTAESVPRARLLYQTALELLETPDLKQRLGPCDNVIGNLDIEIGDPQWGNVWANVRNLLAGIGDAGLLATTAAQVRQVMAGQGTLSARLAQATTIAANAASPTPALTIGAVVTGKQEAFARAHLALLAQPDIASGANRIGAIAQRDFTHGVSLVTGVGADQLPTTELPWLREKKVTAINPTGTALAGTGALTTDSVAINATTSAGFDGRFSVIAPSGKDVFTDITTLAPFASVQIARKPARTFIPAPSFSFCIPPNPILRALRLRAELNLYKLRHCRNIAGVERQLDPYAAPTDTESGLPMIGAGGQLALPGAATLRPTAYRYSVLIERAKQLAGHAQQIETTFLSVLEKRDQEYYNLLKARQDLRLSRAGVRLQDLRLKEAEGGVKLAELQQERAQIQVDHYGKLLDEGVSGLELASLGLLSSVAGLQMASAGLSFLAAALPSSITAGFPPSVSFSPQGSVSAIAGGLSSIAASLSTTASILSTLASYERRAQEWEFQKSIAQQDVRIGGQQVKIAEDHVRVVGQERLISAMQVDHNEAIVEFLANKFTNIELYDWMSDVLEKVYGFFLQEATAMSQLATNQLAFERQEVPPPFIQADYWEPPADGPAGAGDGGSAPDRRGLTGSARLLQDIFQLDQYAFETNKRKLQLTRTVSLARLSPAEFQRFRETGVMTFATPMETFDRDFPGHYLRLIKRVRTSVIALIPAIQGVKATLANIGTSRVVIGGDIFQTTIVRRPPESVALTSARDAIGVFELEPQSEFPFPFENTGVDSFWEFRMPKAANLFDYSTIADVLLTFEYTALNSNDYRAQVIQSLSPSLSAERPFSFRNQFADQWYDLHNPDQTATPMTVRFSTRREDFPPNLESLKIQHVILYFSRKSGKSFEAPVTHLKFTEQGGGGPVGGGSTSIDGVISTRRGNAGSWTAMIGKSPFGEWELALPNTPEMRARFTGEEIEDILFVITYSGRTPEWPV